MTFADILKAGELAVTHGAAMIYHEVAAVTTDVRAWEAANPALAALLDKGVALAEGWLVAHGIPVGSVIILGADVLGVLKAAAAADANIPLSPAVPHA